MIDVLLDYFREYADVLLCSFLCLLLAGQFDNHLWRLMTIGLSYVLQFSVLDGTKMTWWMFLVLAYQMMHVPHLRPKQKKCGSIFVTGADSGMGQATVQYLCQTQNKNNMGAYTTIFAGAYSPEAATLALQNLCGKEAFDKYVKVIPLDVSSDKSVEDAAKAVLAATVTAASTKESDLTALVNYHGIAFNGPLEYMPMKMYYRQHEVNYMGNIRMAQHFLPLLKNSTCKDVRKRLIFTGTGGGPCTPCPPLLSAYMSSKFAGEAMAQCLRMEMHVMGHDIDVAVINPGFVKPTMLMAEGKKLTDQMWKACEDHLGSSKAKDEFGPLMDHFMEYSEKVPGTHVTEVCKAAEHALTAYRPRSSYKVGIDSKLAPIVGMLPTGARELISLHGMYGILSPAGTVKGYRVS